MKNIPEKIYLQLGEDVGEDFKDHHEISWCVDKIYDTDLEYVSIEQVRQLTAERDEASIQSDNPNEASAIEIFKKHGAHYYEDDENDIIAAMEEYKKQGRFYTEAEINEIQAAAYDAGMNTIN